MMKREVKLGEILQGDVARDAVHVAIVPLLAGEVLQPGEHVGKDETGRARKDSEHLGVVDPFLRASVEEGQWCYVLLYPGTITSLRHEWEHPAFDGGGWNESKKWLMDYAKKVNCYDSAEDAFDRLIDGLKGGDLHFHGTEVWNEGGLGEPDELRFHAERYLGIRIDWDKFGFSCSC